MAYICFRLYISYLPGKDKLYRFFYKEDLMIMIRDIFPLTTERVSDHTNPKVNDAIRSETLECLNLYKDSSEKIFSNRIQKLNAEWDTERVLEANASIIVLISSILGFKSNKRWFLLTGAVGFFLLQHALQGWCPLFLL